MKRAAGSIVDKALRRGSGFDKLVAAGIVAISEAPKPRKRGGQPKARTDDAALVWWTKWFQEQYRLAGKPITKRKAIASAMHFRSALRERGGPTLLRKLKGKKNPTWAHAKRRGEPAHFLEAHYYAARRRLQKKK